MKVHQFYKYALGVMLVLNLGVLAFLIFRPPHQSENSKARRGFQNEALRILHLDETQITKFKELAKLHNEDMIRIQAAQTPILKQYFDGITKEDNKSFPNQFLVLEQKKIEVTQQHFKEVKAMLNPSQLPHFEDFIKKATRLLILESKENH